MVWVRTGWNLMLGVCEQEQLSPAVWGCVSLVHSHPPFGIVIPEALGGASGSSQDWVRGAD
jgi:hypothetical protein